MDEDVVALGVVVELFFCFAVQGETKKSENGRPDRTKKPIHFFELVFLWGNAQINYNKRLFFVIVIIVVGRFGVVVVFIVVVIVFGFVF